MSEENKSAPIQSKSQENIQIDVQEPPPPADMNGNDYMTFSEHPEKVAIFITDGKDDKK
uniref:Uncharacterized protein n=1 Tax=Candidatus Kentrum sp. TUN TaxID=2126343 RepID=A0A450ZG69_9GAMM|nr:MAG: hypothetical protein BECKTUN1418F_GA0071002_101329 [Candidatus Kentron sp. TUN]VFK53388.1 MAG: hypothetical protein BECKTUN1418E_GA0071001_101529 [Candidatus Kentron sp. TUN]VFK56892.1 MAG: hypothetical protein BECKTUN1418D_GA0071000_10557 [Candidatus Kentron sp. TUN]